MSALQTATERLIRYATRGTGKQVEPPLSEALSEVEAVCVALEGVLAHGFKTRQFLLFTVHPWAFVEHSEKFGDLNAEAVQTARSVGSTDAARLRAWVYLQLNRRSLQMQLASLLANGELLAMNRGMVGVHAAGLCMSALNTFGAGGGVLGALNLAGTPTGMDSLSWGTVPTLSSTSCPGPSPGIARP